VVIVATRLVVISIAALGASPAASSARKFLLGDVLDDVPVHRLVLTVVPVDERRGRAARVPVQAVASVSCSGAAEARAAVAVIAAATKAPRCFLASGARPAEEDRGTKTSSGEAIGRDNMYFPPRQQRHLVAAAGSAGQAFSTAKWPPGRRPRHEQK
jgi:hypothetical protein